MRGRIHIREKNGHETSRNGENEKRKAKVQIGFQEYIYTSRNGENEKRKAEVQVGFQEYKQNKINRKEKMLF